MALNFDQMPGLRPGNTAYPDGFLENNNTPISEEINQDIFQFFQKLLRDSTVTRSGFPDSELTGFDFVDAMVTKVRESVPIIGATFNTDANADVIQNIFVTGFPNYGRGRNPGDPDVGIAGWTASRVTRRTSDGLRVYRITLNNRFSLTFPYLSFITSINLINGSENTAFYEANVYVHRSNERTYDIYYLPSGTTAIPLPAVNQHIISFVAFSREPTPAELEQEQDNS